MLVLKTRDATALKLQHISKEKGHTMIEFYKFAPNFGMRNASPFVLKLEAYLNLAGLEYKAVEIANPGKAPKGKLPYIIDNGKTVADSSVCIDYLKETYGDPLGEGLSAEQKALGHAVVTMLEERTYWVLVHNRWIDPKNQDTIKNAWFGAIPAPIRGLIFGKIIKDMKVGMRGHGIGRHSEAEIFAFGLKDLQAVQDILGDKPYILGDKPTEYDASIYGLLANFMAKPFPSPMSEFISNSPSLTAYITRVDEAAFGKS
jgi:glutathione S-transferase